MQENTRKHHQWIFAIGYARIFFFNIHDEIDPLILSKEKVEEYIGRFKDLIVDITSDASDLELCFSTILFNEIINNQDSTDDTRILGRIKMSEEKSIYSNYYLKIVSQLFIQTKWCKLFNLNIMETMDLEYSQYIHLKKLLDEYERKYKILAKDSLSEIEKNQQNLLKKYKDI